MGRGIPLQESGSESLENKEQILQDLQNLKSWHHCVDSSVRYSFWSNWERLNQPIGRDRETRCLVKLIAENKVKR